MKLKFCLFCLSVFLISGCKGNPVNPSKDVYNVNDFYNGYYSSIVSWKNGEDLKNQLYNRLNNGYNALTYDDPNWESNQFADEDIYDLDCVNVVYSDINLLKTDTNTGASGWQREHAFCASLLTGYTTSQAVSADKGRATDFHNLFASNGSGNTSRSNKNYGVADPLNPDYKNNFVNGKNDGYACDPTNFEPGNVDKGKLARAIFYMGVMYSKDETVSLSISHRVNDTETKTTTSNVNVTYKGLKIVEEAVSYDKKLTVDNYLFPTLIKNNPELVNYANQMRQQYGNDINGYVKYSDSITSYSIGNLSTLISWSNTFNVDLQEALHNESVFSHVYTKRNVAQGNRNPFIDYPQLVDYVYGNKKNESGELKYLKPSQFDLKTNKKELNHYSIIDVKRDFVVGDTLDSTCYRFVGINGDFSINSSSSFTNTNKDYLFLSSDVGNKKITLVTPTNSITFSVNVSSKEAKAIENCKYYYVLKGKSAGGDLSGFKNGDEAHFGDLNWQIIWHNSSATVGSKNQNNGVAFGASTSSQTGPVGNISFICRNDLENIKAIYFRINCASNQKIDYHIFVNNDVVYENSHSYDKSGACMVGLSLSTLKSGNVKLLIDGSGANNGAVYLHSIGIDY